MVSDYLQTAHNMDQIMDQVCDKLKSLATVLISTHISPDPDAIGSSCALALGLQKLGAKVTIYLSSPIPEVLHGLVSKKLTIVHQVPENKFSGVIVVDTASRKRVGRDWEKFFLNGDCTINIDHHISNDCLADLNYVDSLACASAEIVLDLIDRLQIEVDEEMANLLYAGIADDTGCFRYSNTSERALLSAARLLTLGAKPQKIANELYFSVPERVLKLRALAYQQLKTVLNNKIGTITVTQEMMKSCGAQVQDTEGFVDDARSIKGTIGSVFFREDESSWKISFRSKVDSLDVNAVAAHFGGGGHKAAAGCTIVGSQVEVRNKVLECLAEALEKSRL